MSKSCQIGGIITHAIDRLVGEYGFKGSRKEALRLLRACKKTANGSKSIKISSRSIGISKGQLERWGIPDNKLFVTLDDNKKVITVLDNKQLN